MEKRRKLNTKKLKECLIILVLVALVFVLISSVRKTLSRYQTDANANIKDLEVAFWILDNDFNSESFSIDKIYPNDNPFEYNFTISNFKDYDSLDEDGNSVSGSQNRKVAETILEYDISLETTTNLPLIYELYYGEKKLMSTESTSTPISNTIMNKKLSINQSLTNVSTNILNTTQTRNVYYNNFVAYSANNDSELQIGQKDSSTKKILPETRVYTIKVKFPVTTTMIINDTITDNVEMTEEYSDIVEYVKLSLTSRQKIN